MWKGALTGPPVPFLSKSSSDVAGLGVESTRCCCCVQSRFSQGVLSRSLRALLAHPVLLCAAVSEPYQGSLQEQSRALGHTRLRGQSLHECEHLSRWMLALVM